MATAKISLDDLIIFEGTSKAGKPYSFIKLDRRLANSKSFVAQMKDAGVRINGNQTKEAPVVVEIEQ